MSRVLPYPLLAAGLLLMWMMLNAFTLGHLLLGSAVALLATRTMSALHPSKPRLRRVSSIFRLLAVVAGDVLRSNIGVALVVMRGGRRSTSGFVSIPLELRDRTGLAVLACIVTGTPGTAWIEYDTDTGILLLHVLDLVDEEHWIALIKTRYEARLLEIFE